MPALSQDRLHLVIDTGDAQHSAAFVRVVAPVGRLVPKVHVEQAAGVGSKLPDEGAEIVIEQEANIVVSAGRHRQPLGRYLAVSLLPSGVGRPLLR